jgi:hypothetical protein
VGRCRGRAPHRARGDRGRQEGQGRLSATSAWRLCAAAGLATLIASTAFGWIQGLTPCGDSGGAGAILAFELARTPQAIAALFGAEPCTSRLAAAQAQALWLDLLGFIPAYSAFLALGAAALRPGARQLATAAIAAVLLAGLLDLLEGVVMFRILGDLPGSPGLLDALFWTVRPKFALLGVAEIAIGALLIRRGNWAGKLAGVVSLAGGLASLALLLADPHAPPMMLAHRYAWTALLLVALAASIRPALAVRPHNL